MKKKLCLITVILMIASMTLVGCGEKKTPSDSSSEGSSVSDSSESKKPTVQIYDAETQKVSEVPMENAESGAVTDEQLIKELNKKFAVTAEGDEYKITINQVSEKDGGLYIDFAGSSIPVIAMGSTEEEACLISIAETFLKSYPACSQVYFSVDGANYTSGHLELDQNEPFKYDSKIAK